MIVSEIRFQPITITKNLNNAPVISLRIRIWFLIGVFNIIFWFIIWWNLVTMGTTVAREHVAAQVWWRMMQMRQSNSFRTSVSIPFFHLGWASANLLYFLDPSTMHKPQIVQGRNKKLQNEPEFQWHLRCAPAIMNMKGNNNMKTLWAFDRVTCHKLISLQVARN